jgi:hypothetical protein
MAIDIHWDQGALSMWLTAIEERHLPLLAAEVEQLAYMLAPIRERRSAVPRWAKKGYVGRPGKLKASVTSEMGRDFLGPYADVGSLWYGRFMDPKAKQLHSMIPFLPSALEWTLDGRVYHWE